jgi:hypothetical protein
VELSLQKASAEHAEIGRVDTVLCAEAGKGIAVEGHTVTELFGAAFGEDLAAQKIDNNAFVSIRCRISEHVGRIVTKDKSKAAGQGFREVVSD